MYLSDSVIHSACASFAFCAVHSEEDFGLGSRGHLEAGVDVDQVLELVLVVVVDERLNRPLQTITTLQVSLGQ